MILFPGAIYMYRAIVLGAALVAAPSAIWAGPGVQECRLLGYDKDRLACFDAAAKAEAPVTTVNPDGSTTTVVTSSTHTTTSNSPVERMLNSLPDAPAPSSGNSAVPPSSPPSESAETAAVTTKEIVASSQSTDFKVADPADLSIAPNKFRNKPIEIRRVHCYYADVGDYRCVAPGYRPVAVFTKDILPVDAKAKLESDCGAMKAMMTSKCERTLHLKFSEAEDDMVDAMTHRVILKPAEVTLVPTALKKVR